MNVHHNDPENFIDDPEDFCQYLRSLLSGHKGKKLQKNNTQVSTKQLYGG